VYLHLVFVVDISKDVVTRNSMTTSRKDIHADGLLGDYARNLLIEFFSYHKLLVAWWHSSLLIFALAKERNKLSPSSSRALILLAITMELVDIFLTK
jgi:hypothetical protein